MKKANIISWSIITIGALIIIFSFLFVQNGPEQCVAPAISSVITSSFLTFGVGIALIMIGFAKLYADRWNSR